MQFDAAFNTLLGHEGGYSNHAADPGGATRYGVTEAVAREVGYRGDMRELPLDLARKIYRDKYWDSVRVEDLPAGVRYAVFDAAVNSGPKQAAIWLQRALGVTADGSIGPKTIAAAHEVGAEALRMRMLAQRLKFMAQLANWPAFSRGWANRIADLMET